MRLPILTMIFASLLFTAATAAETDTEAQARRLLNSQGCKACHRIDGEGAAAAPDLSKVGSRLDQKQLRHLLSNPQKRHAAGRIADFSHLQEREIDALVTFLGSRK